MPSVFSVLCALGAIICATQMVDANIKMHLSVGEQYRAYKLAFIGWLVAALAMAVIGVLIM